MTTNSIPSLGIFCASIDPLPKSRRSPVVVGVGGAGIVGVVGVDVMGDGLLLLSFLSLKEESVAAEVILEVKSLL